MSKEINFSKATDKEILDFLKLVKTDENGYISNMEFRSPFNEWVSVSRTTILLHCLTNGFNYRITPEPMPAPEYIPFTYERFHKHRDRWYYKENAKYKELYRPTCYDIGTMDGYIWADAFESLEFEMGEPFGNKIK